MAKIDVKKGFLDVILYLIVFVVSQFVVTNVGALIWSWVEHMPLASVKIGIQEGGNPILMALTTVFSSVISLIVFLKLKWVTLTRDYLQSKPWLTFLWIILFMVGAVIPLEFLYEHLGIKMDVNTVRIFESLLKEPWGYVAVGILAPLAEEIVFRGAILRTLLGMVSKKNHWVAIMISAAIFGVVHDNLAQFINALLMGLLLGWMYYRTKSLVPGILLHWVNNTVAYVMVNLVPSTDGKLIELFKGDEKTMYYAIGFSLCIMIPSFIQMIVRLKKAETRK